MADIESSTTKLSTKILTKQQFQRQGLKDFKGRYFSLEEEKET